MLADRKIPERTYSRAYPPHELLLRLTEEMEKCGISERSRRLFSSMAILPPDKRLAVNLKTLLGLTAIGYIDNILEGGLTDRERSALCELDLSSLPIHFREAAHGLLNVHERWLLLKALSRSLKEAKAAARHYLDARLLGDILGKEEED